MAKFRISFDATPEVGTAPWCGRKSSRVKMIQSITDYLSQRCNAHNVTLMEVIDKPAVAEVSAPKKRLSKQA